MTSRAALCLSLCLAAAAGFRPAAAASYYVASSGGDGASGTLGQPFASLARAQQAASAGDTVFIRGGTYSSFSVASQDVTYQYVVTLNKSGIRYQAYPGDTRPVFDFSAISPDTKRVCGFLVSGSNNTIEGIDVTGIRAGAQKQADNWRISGSGNTLRTVVTRDDEGNGLYLLGNASNNLIENCDSFNLVGISGTSAGNTDGFGCHSGGSGNVFRGDRSWGNSDDGFDCISNTGGGVVFDHCWAYDNGRLDGNKTGFKIGGFGASGGAFPNPPPVHTVVNCLSASNGANGFYANHQPGQAATWLNNTASNNRGANFNMLEAIDTTPANASVAGTREVLHNNLAYGGTGITNLDEIGTMVSSNWFTLPVTVTAADFLSLDASQMTRPRKADGSLPDIDFMHLATGSDLIDAGEEVGLPYARLAPDLGAFEAAGPITIVVSARYAGGTVPADTTLRLDSGAVVAGPLINNGAVQFHQPGMLTIGSPISGTGSLRLTQSGTLQLSAANSFTGSTTVQLGTLRIAHASALASSTLVPLAGGTARVAAGVAAVVGGLQAGAGGLVDVGSGRLTVTAGLTASAASAAIRAGRGDGTWSGTTGITSSAAAAAVGQGLARSVGWIANGDGSVSIAVAAPGDTNLDGQIDILDAANFAGSGRFDTGMPAVWGDGDSGYDGLLDILDAADFLSAGLFDAGAYQVSPSGLAAVPEPSSAWLGATAAGALAVFAARRAIRRSTSRRGGGDGERCCRRRGAAGRGAPASACSLTVRETRRT